MGALYGKFNNCRAVLRLLIRDGLSQYTLLKTSRPEACQLLLSILKFLEKIELCVASNFQAYLEMSKNLRGDIGSFVITTRKSNKSADMQTISR